MVQSTRHTSTWPVGPSEMAERIRRHDWAATSLGPIAGWPPHLRTAVDICLASPAPTAILWGEQRLQIYNDAYRRIARGRHPMILGQPMLDNWPEAREQLALVLDRVFASGEPTRAENWPLRLDDAAGVPEDRFFTFTFSAIRDRYGAVAGAMHTVTETTRGVRAERQLRRVMSEAGLSTDFQALFQAAPAPLLLLTPPQFRIVAANDALLRRSDQTSQALLGRTIFEHLCTSLPGRATLDRQLHESLARVLQTRAPDTLPPVALEQAGEEGPRWWTIINTPVLDARGEVALIIHRAEDITELVHLRSAREAHAQLDSDQRELVARLHETGTASAAAVPSPPALAAATANLASTLDAIPDCVCTFDRECRLTYVNRAMRQLLGCTEAEVLGRRFGELGYPPELARRLEAHIQRTLATGAPREDEVFFTSPAGVRAYFQFVWGPVRDDSGAIVQVVGVSRDTSERRRLEERLRQGEARQSFLLQLGDRVRGVNDAAQIIATVSSTVGHYLAVGRCGYGEMDATGTYFVVARDWTDGQMPSLAGRTRLAEFGAEIVAQYRAGQTVVINDALEDARTRGAEQAYAEAGRVRAGVGVPLVKDGRQVAAFYVHQTRPRHWTDEEVALLAEVAERTWAEVARARAERQLRESERRYRALFNALEEGFCVIEKVASVQPHSDYRFLMTNPAFVAHTGVGGVIGKTVREVFPHATAFWFDTFDNVLASGDAVRFEHGLLRHGRVFDVYACRLDDGSDQRIAVLFNDISARKRHDEHQRLLLNELNHRVKNTLATVQSIAMQTFRRGADPEQARQQFEGRLMALSRAHDILTRESWSGASLAAVVREAIAPYRDQHRERLHADGPTVWLPPRHALAFAMMLHELCTNAVKYGALSNQDGRVDIHWSSNEVLRLQWTESGGPPVIRPNERGFGSRLIERGLRHEMGGKVSLDFAPAGVQCTVETPLDGVAGQDRFA